MGLKLEEIKNLIKESIPDAEITIKDLKKLIHKFRVSNEKAVAVNYLIM